jgi:transcriptional regulator with XRE-family HTH domain
VAGVLAHLGRVCFLARESAGLRQIDIALAADADDGIISRFESGKRVPRDLESLIAAYAKECGAAPETFWLDAIAAWVAEQNLQS